MASRLNTYRSHIQFGGGQGGTIETIKARTDYEAEDKLERKYIHRFPQVRIGAAHLIARGKGNVNPSNQITIPASRVIINPGKSISILAPKGTATRLMGTLKRIGKVTRRKIAGMGKGIRNFPRFDQHIYMQASDERRAKEIVNDHNFQPHSGFKSGSLKVTKIGGRYAVVGDSRNPGRRIRASVNREGMASAGRVYIQLHHSEDGRYRWFGDDGSDTEISGRTVTEAISKAKKSWRGKEWDFRLAGKNPGRRKGRRNLNLMSVPYVVAFLRRDRTVGETHIYAKDFGLAKAKARDYARKYKVKVVSVYQY